MRTRWRSQVGFIWATAGAAIGLGNIWRFPTVAANEGGGVFFLAFFLCILVVGVPMMMGEMAVGRHTARGPIGSYKILAPSSRWPWLGYFAAIINGIILSYYAAIAGACLAYMTRYIGAWVGLTVPPAVNPVPTEGGGTPVLPPLVSVVWLFIFLGLVATIATLGIRRGVERAATRLLPTLLFLLAALVVRIMLLEGAVEGLKWLLIPRWDALGPRTLFAALGQMFFSLSMGAGIIITYASYLPRDRTDIPRSALSVVFADTAVGILASLVVIPSLFAFKFPIVSGPELVFGTVTGLFANLPFGTVFGAAFFAALGIAALTSSLSMMEVIVTAIVDEGRWPRTRAVWVSAAVVSTLGIPSALSMGGIEQAQIGGRPFIDIVDYVATNLMLPTAAVLSVIFIGWVWGAERAHAEITRGSRRFRSGNFWVWSIRYVVPVAITAILLGSVLQRP